MPQITVNIYEVTVGFGPYSELDIEDSAPTNVVRSAQTHLDMVDDCRCFSCDSVIGFYLWEDPDTGYEKGGFTPFWMVHDGDDEIWAVCEDCVSPMDYKHLKWNHDHMRNK